jgi:hypothetical protein
MWAVNEGNRTAWSTDLTVDQVKTALKEVRTAYRDDAATNEERMWLLSTAQSLHEAAASRNLMTPNEIVESPESMGLAVASMGFGGSNGSLPKSVTPNAGYAGPSFRSAFRAYAPPPEEALYTDRSVFSRFPERTTLTFGSVEEQVGFLSSNVPGLSSSQAKSMVDAAFSRESTVVLGGSRVRGNFTDASDLDVGWGSLSEKQAQRVISSINNQGHDVPLERLTIVPEKKTPTIAEIVSPEEFFQRSGVRAGGDLRAGEPYGPSGSITVKKDGTIVLIPPGRH